MYLDRDCEKFENYIIFFMNVRVECEKSHSALFITPVPASRLFSQLFLFDQVLYFSRMYCWWRSSGKSFVMRIVDATTPWISGQPISFYFFLPSWFRALSVSNAMNCCFLALVALHRSRSLTQLPTAQWIMPFLLTQSSLLSRVVFYTRIHGSILRFMCLFYLDFRCFFSCFGDFCLLANSCKKSSLTRLENLGIMCLLKGSLIGSRWRSRMVQ